jgi:hypothetical protein
MFMVISECECEAFMKFMQDNYLYVAKCLTKILAC